MSAKLIYECPVYSYITSAGPVTPPILTQEMGADKMSKKGGAVSPPPQKINLIVDKVNKNAKCRCCLWLVSFWCALTVIFMLSGYDRVVRSVAVDRMVLRQGTQKYEAWVSTPVPVYYRVFVFNLTNPEEFMKGNAPRVEEIGPYVYLMKETKEQISFNKNGSVTYRTKPLYFFQPDQSVGAETDRIVTLNIPFVNAADAVKEAGFLKSIIQIAKKIHNFKTIRKLTVGELLWGHQSRVIDWARTMQEVPYPHKLFGLLTGFNNSVQEPYTMHTGYGDSSKMNQILNWNGKNELNFWGGPLCNKIHGTDANGFEPGLGKDSRLYIFNGQLCRSIPLTYAESVTQNGIEAYRFTPPEDVFAYGPTHPENQCYCSGGACPPTGLLDMKACYYGASIAFSFPHFYKGDQKLRHLVQGLRPDESKHRTEFDIYPDLGVPLRVKLRMQLNIVLDSNQALERLRHYDLVLPVFWFEVGIDSLPNEVVGLLKLAQNLPPVVKTTSVTLCTSLTLIFLILLLAQTVHSWCGQGLRDRDRGSYRGERVDGSLTPDVPPQPTHFSPWLYDLQKPPKSGSNSFERYNEYPNPNPEYLDPNTDTLDSICDPGVIDTHTLLPPYPRSSRIPPESPPNTTEYQNTSPTDYQTGEGVNLSPEASNTSRIPNEPQPNTSRIPPSSPSTISVEVHSTPSDSESDFEQTRSSSMHSESPTQTPTSPSPPTLSLAPLANLDELESPHSRGTSPSPAPPLATSSPSASPPLPPPLESDL